MLRGLPLLKSCGDVISSAASSYILTSCRRILNPQGQLLREAHRIVRFQVHDHRLTSICLTSAFQRLGFAFDILKTPSARRTYDRASKPRSSQLPDKTSFLGGEYTFRGAVEAILHEFMTGDFAIVRGWLQSVHAQYPNLVSEDFVVNIERSFVRIRELVLTTRTYALLIYIELGRINRVQKRLMALGYLDIVGRTRLTVHLVRVTLAVPMRVDKALRLREEKAWRAKMAGLHARGITPREELRTAGILNEKVSRVLQFIVGAAGNDDEGDDP